MHVVRLICFWFWHSGVEVKSIFSGREGTCPLTAQTLSGQVLPYLKLDNGINSNEPLHFIMPEAFVLEDCGSVDHDKLSISDTPPTPPWPLLVVEVKCVAADDLIVLVAFRDQDQILLQPH